MGQLAAGSGAIAMTNTIELQRYLLRRVASESHRLHPDLVDLAGGRSVEEIDACIDDLIKRSVAIRAAQQARAAAGPATAAGEEWQANQREGVGDPGPDVASMDLPAYAAFREAAGIGRSPNSYGIFGK
jgi:hypothetical protein